MEPKGDNSRASRQATLTVVMFGVLLGSVLAAWALTESRQASARAGARLLRRVRDQGLGTYWEAKTVRWYLVRQGQTVVGWVLRVRTQIDAGGFEGFTFSYLVPPQQQVAWSHWRLGPRAKTGRYQAQALSPYTADQATVELADGRIRIQQVLSNRKINSGAPAPANYCPEGTLPLVAAIVAKQREEAKFRLTFDAVPPNGPRPRFFSVTITPHPVDTGIPDAVAAAAIRGRGESLEIHHFDAKGVPVLIAAGNTVTLAATREQVHKFFPGVAGQISEHLGGRSDVSDFLSKVFQDSPNPGR